MEWTHASSWIQKMSRTVEPALVPLGHNSAACPVLPQGSSVIVQKPHFWFYNQTILGIWYWVTFSLNLCLLFYIYMYMYIKYLYMIYSSEIKFLKKLIYLYRLVFYLLWKCFSSKDPRIQNLSIWKLWHFYLSYVPSLVVFLHAKLILDK